MTLPPESCHEARPPILVVDDDPTQRLMFKQVLERDGHRVIEAECGREALQLFMQHKPLLALVDAVMPEMDGFELSQALHAMEGGEELTVLMATSLSEDADINRAFQAGAADFISKPINWTVLRGRVAHLLQGKLAALQMRRTEEQLRQAQKMSAIGSLSSGIAHEFNNILASLMGYTELLQEYLGHHGAERQRAYADEIYSAAGRARDLVHQMQLFSQSKPGSPQRLEPTALVKENLKIIRSSLPATIKLTQQLDDGLLPVTADPAQFQQLLTNLLLNARDATGGKGAIDVSMRHSTLSGQCCSSCHGNFSGEFLQLTITDSGSGIADEVRQKMFDPYYTTKPVGRGTGMGLSVVHGIMHEMGGHIMVDSPHGSGASFSLLFPINTPVFGEEKTMEQHNQTAGHEQVGQHILLIDDEVSITGYLSELLEMKDYKVTTSNDSQEALNLFLTDPTAFDLVITDMTLPGLTGIELASGMLQLRPDLPVILCSGYIDEQTKEQIVETGIRASFHKPVDSRALIDSVATLLQVA